MLEKGKIGEGDEPEEEVSWVYSIAGGGRGVHVFCMAVVV